MIIGLSGKSGHGKDVTAKLIQLIESGISPKNAVNFMNGDDDKIGHWRVVKFASKLKVSMQIKFPEHFSVRRWESEGDAYRNEFLPEFQMTRRQLLIAEGDGLRNVVHPDYWVIASMSEYNGDENWIFTDMRYPNEYDAVKKEGGIVIRIKRKGVEEIDSHTERLLDNHQFDYVITNDGDLEMLGNAVQIILENIQIWRE